MKAALAVGTLAAVAVAAAALDASATRSATTVTVTEKEWSLTPKPARVKAGSVTFVLRNAGKLEHEVVVLRTNRAAAKLPTKGPRAVETGKQGEISKVKPGKSGRVTLRLKAGKYVLICNVPGHYKAGQHSAFTVR
jgi:uncharacterized cupredoxin-like copper-binding protein